MPTPSDQKLYEKAKNKYDNMKHSAYKSGLIVKEYKRLYKEKYGNLKQVYKGPEHKKKEGLNAWFKQDWRNSKGGVGYEGRKDEIYRPTKKYGKTPTTYNELSKKQIADAKKEKLKYGRVKKFDK